MSSTAKTIISLAVIVILAGGAFVLFGRSSSDTSDKSATTGNTSKQQEQSTNSAPTTAEQVDDSTPASATITFSDSGFSPAEITVKSGSTIAISNTSGQTIQLDSDPHPVHTDDPELNVGVVEPGETKKFTLTTKGTWGYHDHLNPSMTGKVVVE